MKRFFLIALSLSLAIFLLLSPEMVRASISASLNLCARSLIPSLFPFFVLSNFVIKSGVLSPSPMVMGALGGYPLGADVICKLYKDNLISKKEAEGALPYCSLCGPGFILGVGSAVFKSLSVAFLLWIVHLIPAFVMRAFLPKLKIAPSTQLPFSTAFTQSVKDALYSCLNICAFVSFFGIFCDFLPSFCGFIELSRGITSLMPSRLSLILGAFYLGFGGLCVNFQVIALCSDAGISAKHHFIAKILHGLASAALMLFLTFFIY